MHAGADHRLKPWRRDEAPGTDCINSDLDSARIASGLGQVIQYRTANFVIGHDVALKPDIVRGARNICPHRIVEGVALHEYCDGFL
jgi:hypothetical protein